jgi:tetratricopeptide (TPR) repeat protein
VTKFADMIAGHMTAYYGLIVFALIVGGIALYLGVRRPPQLTANRWGVVALVILILLVGYIAFMVNLRPIQADMVYKVALSYERSSLPEALRLYEHAIELAPNEDFYYFEIGRVYLMNAIAADTGAIYPENAQAAIDAFVNAQSIAPLNTDHAKGLAKSYHVWAKMAAASGDIGTYQDRIERAEDNYEIATSLSPHNAFLRNEWVQLYQDEARFAYAQRTSVPEQAETWLSLEENYLALGLGVVADSLEIDTEYDRTWLLQGQLYQMQEDLPNAAVAYERAVEVNPGLQEIWELLNAIYLQLERPTDAARALVGLGDMRVSRSSFTEAMGAYNQAMELDPSLPEAWVGQGDAYLGMKLLQEAADAYEQALSLAPEFQDAWEVHKSLVDVYGRMGESDKAISHAQEALELAPEEERADLQAWLAELQASAGNVGP